MAAELQLGLQFGPRHAGHHHIENQTSGLADNIGSRDSLPTRKPGARNPEFLEQNGSDSRTN